MSHDLHHHHHHHDQISGFPSADSFEHRLTTALFGPVISRAAARERQRPRSNFCSLNFLSFENRTASRLAPLYFALFVAGQLAALLAFIRHVFRPTWNQHLQSGAAAMVTTLVTCSLVLCFGEYVFHRYLLHLETVRFLRGLYTSHLKHHKLTSIRFDQTGRVKSA